jgi:hypothetical protein
MNPRKEFDRCTGGRMKHMRAVVWGVQATPYPALFEQISHSRLVLARCVARACAKAMNCLKRALVQEITVSQWPTIKIRVVRSNSIAQRLSTPLLNHKELAH